MEGAMSRPADTDVDIHPLLRDRHSPYVFDPGRDVSEPDLRALLEAARWTMSSYNAQPWRYVVGVKSRDEETWEKIHSVLVEGNQPWAANAPVLLLGVVETNFAHNGEPNKTAGHDLGAASACLTLEATARGLVVHQMAGIVPDAACRVFGLEAPLEPLTALAIGYQGQPGDVDAAYAERDAKPRVRKPVSDILLGGAL
jgi:nitroreductase